MSDPPPTPDPEPPPPADAGPPTPLSPEARDRVLDHVVRNALTGVVPRHVLDADADPGWIHPDHEPACRRLLASASRAADALCTRLERAHHELSSLEDDGLAGRVRYLCTVACVAGVLWPEPPASDEARTPLLRTLHSVVERWRPGATHDLSNAMAALWRQGIDRRTMEDLLGHWIWTHLDDGRAGVHLKWVASTFRFQEAYGREIVERFVERWLWNAP
jgi:hypothetical protein